MACLLVLCGVARQKNAGTFRFILRRRSRLLGHARVIRDFVGAEVSGFPSQPQQKMDGLLAGKVESMSCRLLSGLIISDHLIEENQARLDYRNRQFAE